MLITLILGIASLALGIIFFMDQEALKKLEEIINRPIVWCKEYAYKCNKPIGAVLVILAIVLFYIAWKFAKR